MAIAFLIHSLKNSELSYGCPQTPKGIVFTSQNVIFNELTYSVGSVSSSGSGVGSGSGAT